MIRKCLECGRVFPPGTLKIRKRCKEPCAREAMLRHMRENARKKYGFKAGAPVYCRACGEVIEDRGPTNNRQYHQECLTKEQRRNAKSSTKRRQAERDDRVKGTRVKKVFFNINDLQQASPDRFARMAQTMLGDVT